MRLILRAIFIIFLLALGLSPAAAQNIITTIAGTDFIVPRSVRALDAPLDQAACVAVDGSGNVYVCDSKKNIVARVSRDGMLTVVAGNGIPAGGFSGDGGPATGARLNSPSRLALDWIGNLYLADTNNHRIRKIAVDGTITTVAGTGSGGFSGDGGPATKAQLYSPSGVAVDLAGVLYIADTTNNRVRKVGPDGTITTVAGGGTGGDGGPATSAGLRYVYDVAVDAVGNLYIREWFAIRKVNPQGTISTYRTVDCEGRGLAVDASGSAYVPCRVGTVVRLDPGGSGAVMAGGGWALGDGGPATAANLGSPLDVAVDMANNIYIADSGNHRVRKVSGRGTITTVAGSGQPALSGDGGAAAGATLSEPGGVLADAAGNIYIADSGNGRVRKIGRDGTISTVAGGGTELGDGGPATKALLLEPAGLALDRTGSLYIADYGDWRIRKVDRSGTIATVAGGKRGGDSGDGGPATDALVYGPTGVTVDASGNIYIAEDGRSIRKVDTRGIISTLVADKYPAGVALDTGGNLHMTNTHDHLVQKIAASGALTTVAGNGRAGFSGDGGAATLASLDRPTSLFFDAAGNLYITDRNNQRARKVNANGVISTVAGNGTARFWGDGWAPTMASLSWPEGLAVDATGNVYIADTGNDRIRMIPAGPVTYSVTPTRLAFTATAGASLPVSQQVGLVGSLVGVGWEISAVITNTGGNWLSVSASSGMMPSLISVSARSVTPGTYEGSIEITVPAAAPSVVTIPVTFIVTSPQPAGLSVMPPSLDFRMQAGGATPPAQSLRIENTAGAELNWTAGAATAIGSWLTISPATGYTPASLQVSVNPAGLASGSYSGSVTVRSSGAAQSVTVPVNLAISASTAGVLLLSQTSLLFKAVESGGAEPPQTFGVLNVGRGTIDWTAQAGESWLRISPVSGHSDYASAQIPLVTVSVDSSGLGAGSYVGLIRVASNSANNSPQVVKVEMQVLPAGTKLGASVRPSGLIFVAAAGGASPTAQELSVATPEASAIQFVSQPIGGTWVTRFPDAGSASRDSAGRIMVQPALGNLAANVYRGGLTVMTMNDGALYAVSVLLLLLPAGTPIQSTAVALQDLLPDLDVFSMAAANTGVAEAGSTCTPAKLYVQFTSVFASFQAVVGWPATVRLLVRDDCGNPGVGANVVLSFSNGDPPLVLTDLKNGQHQGAWAPNGYSAQVIVTAQALWQNLQGQATAAAQLGLNPNPKSVILNQGGVLLGAGFERGPVAPGSIISLFGQNLASTAATAQTLPLPRTLNGVRVLVGEKEAPLFYVGPGQVNAQVPVELESDRQLQVRIEANGVTSSPEPLQTAAVRPGIFTLGPPYGNQGAILIANSNKLAMPVTANIPSQPAAVGGVISIFCTGLGATDPAVASGQPGPSAEPLARVTTPVTVTVGGKPATVSFAGMAPGFAAVYQVNAQVPAGVTPGDAVPVVITQGGFASNTATIAVR